MGDHVEIVREKIRAASKLGSGVRAPKRVIEELVAAEEFQSIGGNVQLGIVTGGEFRLFTWVHPVVRGKPEAVMTFLGFDVYREIGAIGPYVVGLPGMT